MILSTLPTVPERPVEQHLGMITGSSVRARSIFHDLWSFLQNLFGGELTAYSRLLEQAKQEAIERLVAQAQEIEADAVLSLRFGTSNVSYRAAEVYVYGTAVKLSGIQEAAADDERC